jgi:type IV pilus assembly protein PilC
MAEFAWEARARTGEIRKGAMEAENENAVEVKLRAQQLTVLKVKKKAKGINLHAPLCHDDRRWLADCAMP